MECLSQKPIETKKENVIVTNRERERDRLGAADRKTGRGAVIEEGLKLES